MKCLCHNLEKQYIPKKRWIIKLQSLISSNCFFFSFIHLQLHFRYLKQKKIIANKIYNYKTPNLENLKCKFNHKVLLNNY